MVLPKDVYENLIKGKAKAQVKKGSIIHVLNAVITSPITVIPYGESEGGRYIIGYEPKLYRAHGLVYKLDKVLLPGHVDSGNTVTFNIQSNVDVNVTRDYRVYVKRSDPSTFTGLGTKVQVRVVPSRYVQKFEPLYAVFMQSLWKHTNAGGMVKAVLNVPECPTISNSLTVNGVCYKLLSRQVSGGGTHGMETYIFVSPSRGSFKVGKSFYRSNSGSTKIESDYVVTI